jgi:hypothetical protein
VPGVGNDLGMNSGFGMPVAMVHGLAQRSTRVSRASSVQVWYTEMLSVCLPGQPCTLHVMRLTLANVGPHGNLHILKDFEYPCAEVAHTPLRFPKSMVTGAKG